MEEVKKSEKILKRRFFKFENPLPSGVAEIVELEPEVKFRNYKSGNQVSGFYYNGDMYTLRNIVLMYANVLGTIEYFKTTTFDFKNQKFENMKLKIQNEPEYWK